MNRRPTVVIVSMSLGVCSQTLSNELVYPTLLTSIVRRRPFRSAETAVYRSVSVEEEGVLVPGARFCCDASKRNVSVCERG